MFSITFEISENNNFIKGIIIPEKNLNLWEKETSKRMFFKYIITKRKKFNKLITNNRNIKLIIKRIKILRNTNNEFMIYSI